MAVELFAEYLMLQFFDTASALTDALRDQLVAETNLLLILNKGGSKRLERPFLAKDPGFGLRAGKFVLASFAATSTRKQ
jgi:hypothetical protein